MKDLTWQNESRCRKENLNPSIFFGTDGVAMTDEDVQYAKGHCADCSVRDQCLEYALELNIEDGVWGGLSEADRRKERRRRRLAGSAFPSVSNRNELARQRATEARRLESMGTPSDQIARQLGVDRRTAQRLTAPVKVSA